MQTTGGVLISTKIGGRKFLANEAPSVTRNDLIAVSFETGSHNANNKLLLKC